MLSALSVTIQASLILILSGYVFASLRIKEDARWIRKRLIPIMVGLFAVAMLSGNRWLVYLVLIAIIPAMARNRSDIPPLYLVAAVSLPSLNTPLAIGSMYLLDVDKWLSLAVGSAIAFAIRPPARGADMEVGRRFDLPLLIFIALEAIQARGNNFTSILRVETNMILSYLLPYLVISRSLNRPEDLRRLVLAMAFVGFAMSGIAIYEAKRSVLLYTMVSHRLGIFETISSYSHMRGGALRATGSFPDATGFGGFLSTALLCLLPAKEGFRSKKARLFAIGGIFVGIYMANTRAAFVGLIVAFLIYDLFRKKYQSFFRTVGLIAAAGIAVVGIAQFSHSMAARIGIAGDSAETTDYRRLLITRGWEEMQKHPLLGMSPGQTFQALADLKQGEGIVDFVNAYVWYGLTTGIIGMVAFLIGFMLSPVKLLAIRPRISRIPYGREIGAMVAAVCIYYAVVAGTSGFGGRGVIIYCAILAIGSALCGMRPPRPFTQPVPDPTDRISAPPLILPGRSPMLVADGK